MRVLLINSVCGVKSTGRIATDIADDYISKGHTCRIAYGREQVPEKYKAIAYRIGNDFDVYVNAFRSRILDNEGFNAKRQTKRFLEWAEEYNPDLLWLHNLHGYYLNVEMLFEWIKSRPQMEVKWTLHDCWAFTGHCAHFTMAECYKWKILCESCKQKTIYPSSILIDASEQNFIKKRECFCGIKKMTIITPSKWLANIVKQSFLKEYPIEVQHNRIDKTIFKPTPSDFREKNGLENKVIILGVATAWSLNKGLNDFIELSKLLNPKYKIVLIGLNEKQIKTIPNSIICIPKTNNMQQLAGIYTAADIHLSLSREETFGLTIVEALACGTPAIVYKGTAGEEVAEANGGIVVDRSLGEIIKAIEYIIKD